MWNTAIQETDALDPNWRSLIMFTWLHPQLDTLIGPLMQDTDILLRHILSPTEYAFFEANTIIGPITPYITDSAGSSQEFKGGGVGIWLHTDLDNVMQMTTRNKVLTACLGSTQSPTGLGTTLGVKVVYYQSTSDTQPLKLNIDTIPEEHRTSDIWFAKFSNLPPQITSHKMLIILQEGYHFAPEDICNIYLEYDQLNDRDVSLNARGVPCMMVLFSSPDGVRTC
jgi:hypothetical protein